MAKQQDVKIGQVWRVKVSGMRRDCQVDSITQPEQGYNWRTGQHQRKKRLEIHLTNLVTGNKITRSSAALISLVSSPLE